MAEQKIYLSTVRDFGNGSDGTVNHAANFEELIKAERQHTELTIAAGVTYTIGNTFTADLNNFAPYIIRCTGTFINRGTIDLSEKGYRYNSRALQFGTAFGVYNGSGGGGASSLEDGISGVISRGVGRGAKQIGLFLKELLKNDLANMPPGGGVGGKSGDGGSPGRSGANLILIVDKFIQSSTGLIRLNGGNATRGRQGGGHGGGGAGTVYIVCNTAEVSGTIEANGGSGVSVTNRRGGNGANGAAIFLYSRSISKTGATLPTNVYEEKIFRSVPLGSLIGGD